MVCGRVGGCGADVCVSPSFSVAFLSFFFSVLLHFTLTRCSFLLLLPARFCSFSFFFSAYSLSADDSGLRIVMKGDGTTAIPLSIYLAPSALVFLFR